MRAAGLPAGSPRSLANQASLFSASVCARDTGQRPPSAPSPAVSTSPPPDAEIDKLLREPGLQYKFNVDVTSFSASDRKRVTLNYNGNSAPEEEAGA